MDTPRKKKGDEVGILFMGNCTRKGWQQNGLQKVQQNALWRMHTTKQVCWQSALAYIGTNLKDVSTGCKRIMIRNSRVERRDSCWCSKLTFTTSTVKREWATIWWGRRDIYLHAWTNRGMLIKCARVLHKQHDKGMSGKVTTTPSFSLQDTKALCNSCERATNLPRAQFWLHKQQKFYQTFSKQEQAWQTPAGVACACTKCDCTCLQIFHWLTRYRWQTN